MGVMIVVIIAGGSGTRLWPLSTPEYPKHLLTLNGDLSLLQSTYVRAKKLANEVYVIPEIGHVQHVRDQLPEIDEDHLIIEPARRGTASCVVAGLERISRSHDEDETIAFIAADHYIRDQQGFLHSFKVADNAAQKEKRIVLIGAEPYYPATGFGYIEKGEVYNEDSFVYCVKSFKEKPDYDVAKRYLKSGNYLWNCSYFVATLGTFISSMQQHAPELYRQYQELRGANESTCKEIYLGFESVAIDYALIEKVDNLLVVPASFDWMDLGSYGDLHDAVESDGEGNHIAGPNVELEGVSNSYVRNDEGRPLAVIGLDNVAVINTANGIVVTRKDMAQKVGEISKRYNEETS